MHHKKQAKEIIYQLKKGIQQIIKWNTNQYSHDAEMDQYCHEQIMISSKREN